MMYLRLITTLITILKNERTMESMTYFFREYSETVNGKQRRFNQIKVKLKIFNI